MNESRQKKTLAAIVALTMIAAVLFFVFWPRDEARPVAKPAPASTEPRIVVGGNPSPEIVPTVLVAPAGSASQGPPAVPIIDEITVEKSEVCEGEENLVTVRAHSPDGANGLITYMIGAERGSQVPVRRYLDDKEDTQIVVHGARGAAVMALVPKYRVMNCRVAYMGDIGAWLLPNTEAKFELGARAIATSAPDAGAKPFVPVEYVWNFGDGTTETTKQERVRHSFEDRPMNSLDSDFLITVEMRAADGQKVVARKSVTLRNALFEDFHDKGIVALQSYRDPQFPEMSSDGVVNQGIRLRHLRPNAVHIDKVTRQVFYDDKTGNAQSDPLSVDVTAVLGTTEIPSGRGLDIRIKWDTTSEAEVNMITYALHGKTVEGYPVEGRFSIMRPAPKPSKTEGDIINDPVLIAKIMAAQKILGKTSVSNEEIANLEREGKFKDLQVGK